MTRLTSVMDPRFKPGRKMMVLIDQYEDEIVESTAWVEVYDPAVRVCSFAGVRTPEEAVEVIERQFPLEDRPEAEGYACYGDTVWMMPDAEWKEGVFVQRENGDSPREYHWPEVPFTEAENPREPFALKFWVVRVVCEL